MISTLPDPMTEHGIDPIQAYVQGCEARLRDAAEAHLAQHTQETWNALLLAQRTYKSAMLDQFGVECPREGCNDGMVYVGVRQDGARRQPPEPVHVECDVCGGEGLVLPEDL